LRLKILKKLRTASLNSEFTGSYKKVYNANHRVRFSVHTANQIALSVSKLLKGH